MKNITVLELAGEPAILERNRFCIKDFAKN